MSARRLLPLLGITLLLPATLAQAEYCVDFSPNLRKWLAKQGDNRSRACFPTKEACQSYVSSSGSSNVHKHDLSGGCYSSGGSGSSSSGGGKKGKKVDPVKQAVQGTLLNAMEQILNPPKPKPKAPVVPQGPSPQQLRVEELKRLEQAAAEEQFHANRGDLLGGLKGNVAQSRPDTIDLKIPAAGSHHWDGARPDAPAPPLTGLKPPPPVPEPVSADDFQLQELEERISTTRQQQERHLQEVKRREAELARAETKFKVEQQAGRTSDDDALRKAREALEKAKAEQQKIEAELRQLEEQAAAARDEQPGSP